jgi:hypothetical protein
MSGFHFISCDSHYTIQEEEFNREGAEGENKEGNLNYNGYKN